MRELYIRNIMKLGCLSYIIFSVSNMSMAYSNGLMYIRPDPELTYYLSSAGPLSVESMESLKRQAANDKKVRINNSWRGSTYTYLRCFYSTSDNSAHPTSAYVWGIDPSSRDYYRINGRWWAGGVLSWQNMFYSEVSQDTLKSVCHSTFAQKGIQKAPIMLAAANNALSFNYAIWSNDNKEQGTKINKMIAFGDSLSDNQNMYNATLWTLPNSKSWYAGRFSNGKNWVEYVSDDLKLPLYNWAVGGAGIDSEEKLIPSVIEQVQSWEQYMQRAQNYRPENTLFTLFVGANDLINYDSAVDQIICGKRRALHSLIQAGARNILLLTLPDVSRAPLFKLRKSGNTIKNKIQDLNAQLVKLTHDLQAEYGPSLVIRLFDTYPVFDDLMDNPNKYYIYNTTTSCLNINTDSIMNYLKSSEPRTLCTDPDAFVFWDILHPTTRIHRILADFVTRFVHVNFNQLNED